MKRAMGRPKGSFYGGWRWWWLIVVCIIVIVIVGGGFGGGNVAVEGDSSHTSGTDVNLVVGDGAQAALDHPATDDCLHECDVMWEGRRGAR